MSEINYRLIFNGAAPGADIRKLLIFFQKDLELPNDRIQKLMISSPRVIREFSTQHSAELIQTALPKIGGITFVEPVNVYSSDKLTVSAAHGQLIAGC